MAYPDPPGTTSATLHRINDLSLRVASPVGTVYHGNNGLLAGNGSTPGGSPNTIDTVENVFVPERRGRDLDGRGARGGDQPGRAILRTPAADAVFALVVTGGRPPADQHRDE